MNTTEFSLSTFLTATPTPFEAGRLLDFGSTFDSYNESESGAEADALALRMDAQVVGLLLWEALTKLTGSLSNDD